MLVECVCSFSIISVRQVVDVKVVTLLSLTTNLNYSVGRDRP